MIDYYKELGLLKTASLDEIQETLAKLRNTWENRRMSGNEAAEKKLVLLIDAEKVFKNENSRSQYDRELELVGKKPETSDSNKERKANFDKWFAEANSYLNSQEYDLAKSAIDKAFQFRSPQDENAFLYSQAAEIYRLNLDYRSALTFINESIVLDKSNPWNYLTKNLIYEALDTNFNSDRANFGAEKRKSILENALNFAKESHNPSAIGTALGMLAHTWYWFGIKDIEKAAAYAFESLKYNSDDPNAKKVLDDIERVRIQEEARAQQQHEAEETRARQQREAKEALIKQQHENEAMERVRNQLLEKTNKKRIVLSILYLSSWALLIIGAFVFYAEVTNGSGVSYPNKGYFIIFTIAFFLSMVNRHDDYGTLEIVLNVIAFIWGTVHAFIWASGFYYVNGGNFLSGLGKSSLYTVIAFAVGFMAQKIIAESGVLDDVF